MVWVYSKSWRLSRAEKFTNFIGYCGFGLFTTILNTLIDFQFFFRHLVRLDLNKFKHKTNHIDLEKDNIKLINKFFFRQQEKIINYKFIAEKLRSNMGIMPLMRQALFP